MANLLSTNVSGRLYTSGHVDTAITNAAFRFYDGTTFRGGLGLDDWAHGGSSNDLTLYVANNGSLFITTNSIKRHFFNSGEAAFRTYAPDLNYKISVTGGDQLNAYYGSGAATLYLQYHGASGGDLNVANGKLTVNTAGSVVASGDMRAPVFYDSADTSYYVDPNSYSRIYRTSTHIAPSPGVGSSNWVNDFNATPTSSMSFGGDLSSGGPQGTWWFQQNFRHSNSSNYWGTQVAWGWEDNANELWQRNVTGGSWSGWVRYINTNNYTGILDSRYQQSSTAITTSNIGSQNVNSASYSNYVIDSSSVRITSPVSAFSVNNGYPSGAIRINLPRAVYNNNTMMSMTVDVYEYSTGQSFTLRIGGYNYLDGGWYNVFASLINDSGQNNNIPVYFGNNGSDRNVIWIGEPNWGFAYPNVFVRDFQAGHSQNSGWASDWSISFDPNPRTNVGASRIAYKQIDAGNITSSHFHDLARYSLRSPGNVDSMTSSNFRTQLFGSSGSGHNISTARWNSVPSGLSGMNMYGTMIAWSGSDTHGFIAADYSTANIQVGGGSGDSITWKATLIHSGNISSQSVSYATSAGNSSTTSQIVFNDLKINFPSGAGGGHSFASNHYSMGLDSGNGGWDGPHYRDIIIGYHTGVRIGAHYSGIRFYDNSPTTDANNDGNGDGGEKLLMTIGGYVGTANHTDVVVNNNLFANVSMRAPIFYDSNDTNYYLDPNGNSRISRDLYIDGNRGGNFGNRLIIGATTTPHTLQDGNLRPTAYLRGAYPVLTLDHTETGNTEHGPTIQFVFNGSNARQWLIGCGGSGNFMDFGFSSSGYGNTDYNPHYGISGYQGNTIMRIIDSRVGIGGDWGAYGSVANPEHTLDVRGTIFSNTDMRAPIFYDSQDTGYYLDPNGSSNLNNVTANQSYANGWFRNNGSNTGLYNQSTTMHWSSNVNGYWDASSTTSVSSIRFYTGGHLSAIRGYVYANDSNQIGFLNNGGSWSLRTDSSRNTVLFGNLTVGQDVGYSSIYMYDSDEGTREIHCNSQRIGFLTQAGAWGSYCNDDGSWVSLIASYAPIYYDSQDTAYYLDPAGTSRLGGLMLEANLETGRGSYGADKANLVLLASSTYGRAAIDFRSGVNYPSDGAQIYYETATNLSSGETSRLVIRTENDADDSILIRGGFIELNTTTVDGGSSSPGVRTQYNGNNRLLTYSDHTAETSSFNAPQFLVNNHSDNTRGYRIHNTSGSSVSAMFTNSANALVIGAGAFDQVQLNKKTLISGAALGVNIAASATAGRIDASNDIVAYSTSDERFKENITPISNALDKVKTLTGVEFDWRMETKDYHGYVGHDVGVIAQQVKAVLPEAVRTNANGYLAVRYEKLIGLLIEANKELAARVEELEKKLS